MGRYSDSDEDSRDSRRLKKKKKRRSRSRSRSSQDSYYSNTKSHKSKAKKSKKKHKRRSPSRSRSRSRSCTPDKFGRRRRSRSSSRSRRSRSYDRSRRSRSKDKRRSRSRSYERSRRSRSYSRGRRSRSDSRGRYISKRSSSRSHSQSRRSSPGYRKGRRSSSPSPSSRMSDLNVFDDIPGFAAMTPAEQAQARMKLALRAAAAADDKLKVDTSGLGGARPTSPLSRKEFHDAVASIENDSFVQSGFRSGTSAKANIKTEGGDSHHLAMFGAVGSSVVFTKTEVVDKNQPALEDDPKTLFDSSLDVDPAIKMERWIQKLTYMRRKKLEGDVMGAK